jgi:hypothetical protein
VIPWSDAERSSRDEVRDGAPADERDDAREEAVLRGLFEGRARALLAPGPRVPPLGEVLRAAHVRDTPVRRARLLAGATLAAACFAAVVYGHRGGGAWVDVVQARAEDGVDGGLQTSRMGGALASWGWRADDLACSADGVRPYARDEALACFSPRAVKQEFTPVPATPARIASDIAPSCPLDDP